jgi:hypothetical protein
MAYKVFSNGDALTGGELNTFLMNQSVIAFASVAARNAAIPAPLEGQLVWLEDSNKYVYYSGSAWVDLLVPASSGNAIINGAMEIWQRGTSFTLANNTATYTADRFYAFSTQSSGSAVVSQQAFTPGAAPVAGYESSFFLRYACATTSTYSEIGHRVEDVRNFAGQTATLSFWAKASSATTLNTFFTQTFGSGGSGNVSATGSVSSVSLTTAWQRFSVTYTVPSVSGKTIGAGSNIWLPMTFTPASGLTVDIWGVQLESGSTATAFKRNANSIQGELAACQRYYVRFGGSTLNEFIGWGAPFNTTNCVFSRTLPVEMRVLPTSIEFSTLAANDTAVGPVITSLTLSDNAGRQVIRVLGTVASGLTQFRYTTLVSSNSLNGFLGVSAEL